MAEEKMAEEKMNVDFLMECLVGNPHAETVMRDYVSFDGYKVVSCPYQSYQDGSGVTGSGVFIPASVQGRILETLREMREEGMREKTYY